MPAKIKLDIDQLKNPIEVQQLQMWKVAEIMNVSVHHIDGNTLNNNIDNPELFSNNGKHLQKTLKGQCPVWSEEGKKRISEGLKKRTNQILLGIGVPQRCQTTGRWMSKHGTLSPEAS